MMAADPYGASIPSPLGSGPTGGGGGSGTGGVPAYDPPGIPPYLKPIPINHRDIHAELRRYLNPREKRIARWLYSTWNAEREAIKFQEIRNAIRDGEVPPEWIERWQQDYARFVAEVLEPEWDQAMKAAAEKVIEGAADAGYVLPEFDEAHQRVVEWVRTRGAELITDLTAEQQAALRILIHRLGIEQQMGPEELARYLRPVIGLTQREAEAVARFREALLQDGLDPRKVEHRAQNYAAWLNRRRAERIARTELAFAYNFGQFETVRQAVEQGHLPRERVVKVFSTADDERVCPRCGPLDGARIGLEETFPGATKRLPFVFVPPLHPRCRCAVIYEVLEDERTPKTGVSERHQLLVKMDELLSTLNRKVVIPDACSGAGIAT